MKIDGKSGRLTSALWRSNISRKLRVVVPILAVIYIIISLVIAYGFSMPGNSVPQISPAEYSAIYEDVSFNSRIDHVLLQSW